MLLSLGVSLGLTLVLELAFALVWGIRDRKLLLVTLMNIMTNPAAVTVHILLTGLAGWSYWASAISVETAVVLAEWLCLRGQVRRPFLTALLINCFSFGIGLFLQGGFT